MKDAPLIPDFRQTRVEEDIEFGRTPEFQFTTQYLTNDQTLAIVSKAHTAGSARLIEHAEIGSLAGSSALVTARIFMSFDFGRYEAVVRAMEAAGYRPAVIAEGESLMQTPGFWEILDVKRFFPLCCLGSGLSLDGDHKYFPYISLENEEALACRGNVMWRSDVSQSVFARHALLGIKV